MCKQSMNLRFEHLSQSKKGVFADFELRVQLEMRPFLLTKVNNIHILHDTHSLPFGEGYCCTISILATGRFRAWDIVYKLFS